MRESSIVIHKGGKEEKYKLYIEDYVMSFLREETGTLELSEIYFYGVRENTGRRYRIYGAGKKKDLPFFDKYSLLEEVGCRLTQAGPVFLVREQNETYEIKGYDIFYQDNREMQNYLIDCRKEVHGKVGAAPQNDAPPAAGSRKEHGRTIPQTKPQHSAISVQLGVILVVLVAIVVNSANSYDKMNELNQSATEVLFAIENQDAGEDAYAGGHTADEESGKTVQTSEELAEEEAPGAADEGELTAVSVTRTEEEKNEPAQDDEPEEDPAPTQDEQETPENGGADGGETQMRQSDGEDVAQDGQEGVEALSRNVSRYYEVEQGDTLYTISRKIYGDATYVQKICDLNQITDPDHIRCGQKIVLP